MDTTDKKEHPKQVRIDQDTYTKAQKKAKAMGLNFSAYVRYLIIKDLGD